MTNVQISDLAARAGFGGNLRSNHSYKLARFAELVAAAERERIAESFSECETVEDFRVVLRRLGL